MNDEIRVSIASYGEGRNLMMTYFDPITGKKVAKSSGTTDHDTAVGRAAVWQAELNSGRYAAPSRLTWKEFRERYETEKLSGLAPGTQVAAGLSLDLVERLVNPDRLAKLTPPVLSRLQSEMRKPRQVTRANGDRVTLPPMKETTIARHLRHIKAALRWGEKVGLMVKAPAIEMPKTAHGQSFMRGRAITAEEFDRLLAAVPRVFLPDLRHRKHREVPFEPSAARLAAAAPRIDAWRRLLWGLWLSGLRLAEACALSWDEEAPFAVDLSGKRPCFRIHAEAQKNRRDELLPMTPDFAEWLLKTPESQREGYVFDIADCRGSQRLLPHRVGELIGRIGKRAGVVVNKAEGKYASAHDLRRAFGTRWSKRVMPAVLKQLMRHADIGTTMKYYVSANAADLADELWASFGPTGTPSDRGNTPGNTHPEATKKLERAPGDQSPEALTES